MKILEQIKFICGITLLSFAIIGGVIFFLESLSIIHSILKNTYSISEIWGGRRENASNTPNFLGLCGLAGAYLLASVNFNKIDNK